MAEKLNAQQRLQFMLGGSMFDAELLKDRVEELTAQLAERDATIKQLEEKSKDAA
jgi:hypothetical protein